MAKQTFSVTKLDVLIGNILRLNGHEPNRLIKPLQEAGFSTRDWSNVTHPLLPERRFGIKVDRALNTLNTANLIEIKQVLEELREILVVKEEAEIPKPVAPDGFRIIKKGANYHLVSSEFPELPQHFPVGGNQEQLNKAVKLGVAAYDARAVEHRLTREALGPNYEFRRDRDIDPVAGILRITNKITGLSYDAPYGDLNPDIDQAHLKTALTAIQQDGESLDSLRDIGYFIHREGGQLLLEHSNAQWSSVIDLASPQAERSAQLIETYETAKANANNERAPEGFQLVEREDVYHLYANEFPELQLRLSGDELETQIKRGAKLLTEQGDAYQQRLAALGPCYTVARISDSKGPGGRLRLMHKEFGLTYDAAYGAADEATDRNQMTAAFKAAEQDLPIIKDLCFRHGYVVYKEDGQIAMLHTYPEWNRSVDLTAPQAERSAALAAARERGDALAKQHGALLNTVMQEHGYESRIDERKGCFVLTHPYYEPMEIFFIDPELPLLAKGMVEQLELAPFPQDRIVSQYTSRFQYDYGFEVIEDENTLILSSPERDMELEVDLTKGVTDALKPLRKLLISLTEPERVKAVTQHEDMKAAALAVVEETPAPVAAYPVAEAAPVEDTPAPVAAEEAIDAVAAAGESARPLDDEAMESAEIETEPSGSREVALTLKPAPALAIVTELPVAVQAPPRDYTESFGFKLALLREQRGISANDLRIAINRELFVRKESPEPTVQPNDIFDWERNASLPTPGQFELLLEIVVHENPAFTLDERPGIEAELRQAFTDAQDILARGEELSEVNSEFGQLLRELRETQDGSVTINRKEIADHINAGPQQRVKLEDVICICAGAIVPEPSVAQATVRAMKKLAGISERSVKELYDAYETDKQRMDEKGRTWETRIQAEPEQPVRLRA